MQIISVSRGTHAGGQQLAEQLATKLGYSCLSREGLADGAAEAGIPLGKLEMAVLRRRPLNEQLNLEKERFKAFVAATLADRALTGGLVYHGRTGHMQLAGVSHVMRLRAIMDPEARIGLTMQRLGLTRDKARAYNHDVDEDRHRWVRTLHNVDWNDPGLYDLVVNLSHINVANAAAGLVGLAKLPEFQSTPANERTLADISLAGHCRLAIGDDTRTHAMDVQVRAESGHVLVTYLPRQQKAAPLLPEVLERVDGIAEVVCTMASTNLLWVQEDYDATSDTLDELLEIATRWDSAIELVQLRSDAPPIQPDEDAEVALLGAESSPAENGGILDDVNVPAAATDSDVGATIAKLVQAGRAGGHRKVHGGPKDLLQGLDRTAPYSFIVVGDVFLSKGSSVRKRLARELIAYLSDNMRVPVISTEELKAQTAFGPKQWAQMLGFALVTAVTFGLVLNHQTEVLTFLTREGTTNRILATACLFCLVPAFAYFYGGFTRQLLRLFKFE